ncbi:MAG: mechanosensitive ion channel domain-containing protein [Pseudomonadota bacterium]
MNSEAPLLANASAIAGELQAFGERAWQVFFQPWTLYQAFILIASYLVAHLIAKRIEPPLEAWVRSLQMNAGFLRLLAALLRRVEWIVFTALTGLAYILVVSNTWPSRAFFLKLAFSLAMAWLTIAVLSRIIRSRSIARFAAVVAWSVVALNITGTLGDATELLDSAALSVGEIRISVLLVLQAVALTVGLTWFAVNLGNYAERRVKSLPDLTPSLQVLIGKCLKILFVILAVAFALNAVGVDLTALTIFSGAIGVGLGFGLQKVVSNFISGVIILLDKSIKPGDTISLGETFGWIRELRSRFVSVVTRDGREFLIPNEDFITTQVVNWSFTDELVRLDVTFGVAYDSDPHEVSRLVKQAISDVERVNKVRKPVCWLTEFGDSSLNFIARFWISDPQNGLTNIRGQVMLAIWDVLKENDIGIPFPHREIIMRTPVEVETKAPKD